MEGHHGPKKPPTVFSKNGVEGENVGGNQVLKATIEMGASASNGLQLDSLVDMKEAKDI